MKYFIFITTIIAFLALAFLPVQGSGAENVDPKTLFEKKCITCHSTSRAKSLNKTKEEWTKIVTNCKERRNSNITDDEAKIIIDYLTKTYGKK